jgi:large subunit ribosomal protein L4
MDVPVINMQGQVVGQLAIDEAGLGGEVNPALIKQAYVRYHGNQRQGSSKTKNRHEVEGTTKKMYKQKGTGNARHGDRKVNIFIGGGHGHSKKKVREDFRADMPKKMRRKANRNALLAKLVDREVRVVDTIAFSEPKTKVFKDFLKAINVDKSALVILPGDKTAADHTLRSGRNVEDVKIARTEDLNVFNMLSHRFVVITKTELESWLKGPSSQTGKDAKISPLGRKPEADAPAKAPAAAAPAAEAKAPAKAKKPAAAKDAKAPAAKKGTVS